MTRTIKALALGLLLAAGVASVAAFTPLVRGGTVMLVLFTDQAKYPAGLPFDELRERLVLEYDGETATKMICYTAIIGENGFGGGMFDYENTSRSFDVVPGKELPGIGELCLPGDRWSERLPGRLKWHDSPILRGDQHTADKASRLLSDVGIKLAADESMLYVVATAADERQRSEIKTRPLIVLFSDK